MKNLWTVARKELRSYLDHPTAYILVVAFLVLALFLTFRDLYAAGAATLRPFFDLLPWLFAVFIPAMTMRSLAEEHRSHTLEWLISQPLQEMEVVLGKFLGNWLLVLLALAGTIPTAVGLLILSDADPGIMVAQYVGAALLAAHGVAIGLWASSATKNQVTAFILGIAVTFTFVLIGTRVVTIGLPPTLGGAAASLSVLGHFDNVARGVVDLRDVLYFLSVGGVFLVLAWAVVARRRLSTSRSGYRRLQIGTGIAVAVVLVLNLLGSHIRGRLDLTSENLYTLSQGTREILGGLEDLVTVKLVVSRELPAEIQLTERDVRDLLGDLRRVSDGRIRIDELNPDEDEDAAQEARSLGIRPIQFNVLRGDEFQAKRGWFGLAVLYADEREVIPVIRETSDLEYRLVSAIATMTRDEEPVLATLTGFGTKTMSELGEFQRSVSDRYRLRTIDLQGDSIREIGPDSIDVVVLAGPGQPLSQGARQQIRSFIEAGGAALILVDKNQINPQAPVSRSIPMGLEEFLAESGVEVRDGMVYDLQANERVSMGQQAGFQLVRSYPLWPIVFAAADHPITRDLENMALGWANAMEITDSVHVVPLWETTEAAGIQDPGGTIMPDNEAFANPNRDSLGVRTVAVAVDPTRTSEEAPPETEEGGTEMTPVAGRMVVVGDSDFLTGQFTRANPGNVTFAANAVDWLAQDEALIRIRSKDRTPPALVFDSQVVKSALKWGNLAGMPLFFALIGVWRVTGRRRRAERAWKEV